MKLIVTAGGGGTKLWPYSRSDKPKHFQKILGDSSLYSYTVDTLLNAFDAGDIFVSTKKKYLGYATQQAPQIPLQNFIIEPDIGKNRGPAEGLAFLIMSMKFPAEPFMIIQSDCIRAPEDKFLQMIIEAEKLVRRDKKFMTSGMKASSPMLGVDYLKVGKKIELDSELDFFYIDEFVGRTEDYLSTKKLIESFYITTHCNHYCWFPDLMLDAYQQYQPAWYDGLMQIKDALSTSNPDQEIERIYTQMPQGPTEDVTKHIFKDGFLMLLPFKWTDIGSWSSVYEHFTSEKDLYTDGKVIALDSSRSVIKGHDPNKLIAVLGLDDAIVIDTEDVLLIMPKEKAGDISKVRKHLEESGNEHYL